MTQVGEISPRRWDLYGMRSVGYGGPVILTGREGCEKPGLEERGGRHLAGPCFLEKSHFPRLSVPAPVASGWQRIAGACDGTECCAACHEPLLRGI